MKNAELMQIRLGLSMLDGIGNFELGVIRARISNKVEEYIKEWESFKEDKIWTDYEEALAEINKKHCKKDKDGRLVVDNGYYVFENQTQRDVEVKLLEKEKHEAYSFRKEKLEGYKQHLEKEFEGTLMKIPASLIRRIEKEYEDRKQPSPFKSEITVLLWPVIDMEN